MGEWPSGRVWQGAIGGPMGAFMALPMAALITAFVKEYARKYPIVYKCACDVDDEPAVTGADLS